MAIWANLPPELATHILRELEPSRKTPDERRAARMHSRVDQDLLSCTYVSHQFRAIIEPLLYCSIDLPVLWDSKQGHDPFQTRRQFTRALALRPELGNYVYDLNITSLDNGYQSKGDTKDFIAACNTVYDEDQVEELLTVASEVASSDLRSILLALKPLGLNNGLVLQGGTNGLLIILFHLLPKLRTLGITAWSEPEFVAHSYFGAFTGGVPAGLKSVSWVSLSYGDTENGFGTAVVAPFIALPSIEALIIGSFAAEDGGDGSPWLQFGDIPTSTTSASSSPENALPSTFHKTPVGYALVAQSSSIKHITLENSVVASSIINKILSVPSGLEKFMYGAGGATVAYEPFRPAGFLPGLLSQAASLKELVIYHDIDDIIDDEDEPFIGSLSGLVALETLRVPARLLLSDFMEAELAGDGGEDEESDPAISRNPMDDLLPPNLISLHYDVQSTALKRFCKSTGLPKSLRPTRERVPSLTNFTIGEGSMPPADDILREIMSQTPALQPPMNVNFFGSENTDKQYISPTSNETQSIRE
ncbi:hypothetical protein DL93DRAFT_493798 [Clavulina sp. PMI_390]|nr:hypothetical protein DL93DRAFT_493798 [Clavulina sp. PMI_390]